MEATPREPASGRERVLATACLAEAAGVEDPDAFARQWHILMKGSIVAAAEGDTEAAARARELGALLLAHHGVAT
jgi:hypothetical protein